MSEKLKAAIPKAEKLKESLRQQFEEEYQQKVRLSFLFVVCLCIGNFSMALSLCLGGMAFRRGEKAKTCCGRGSETAANRAAKEATAETET